VGLPRSNLVKPKSSEAPSAVAAPQPILAPIVAPLAPVAPVDTVPSPFAVPQPFAFAPTGALPMPPGVPVPALFAATPAATEAPAAAAAEPARESFRTNADSVEIEMESQRAPATNRDPAPFSASFGASPSAPVKSIAAALPFASLEPARPAYASSPSANELLERAAALGPARMTWESIVLPADPILDEKRQPRVAERRARLTRVVKITLGACLGVCVLALGVSALSGDASAAPAASAAAIGKTVPSKGIVPVEPMDGTKHGKAARRTAPAVTTAAIVRPKHR
jgi:hypothetical protein